MISLVIGFRDRDLKRVKRSLDSLLSQNYNKFELLFIDYGSNFGYALEIRSLMSNYPFVKYKHADTNGQFWNRAHALNIGAKLSKGDTLVFSDIDLIYPDNFIERLEREEFENTYNTFSCYYLNKEVDYNNINDDYKSKSSINYVGLCAMKKVYWESVGGYDEYYMHWGGEDDDFYKRLEYNGIKRNHFGVDKFEVLHQWHITQQLPHPTPWYLEMIHRLYYFQNKNLNNINEVGNIISNVNRIAFESLPENEIITLELYPNKLFQYNLFLEGFFQLKKGQICKFPFSKPIKRISKPSRKEIFLNVINMFLKNVGLTISFLGKKQTNSVHDLQQWNDFVMYFIGKNRNLIYDYKIVNSDTESILYIQKD